MRHEPASVATLGQAVPGSPAPFGAQGREFGSKPAPAPARATFAGLQYFALVFLSLVLLVLSRVSYGPLEDARRGFTDLVTPALEFASLPSAYVRRNWRRIEGYVDSIDEMEQLKEENERLRQWQWQVEQLEWRLARMRELLHAVDEPALPFKSSRVIADAGGPFTRAVLINLGREDGVRSGSAVINAEGLVGRVVHVGAGASRVVLLNDVNSRIPVVVGPRAVRAVMIGDNARRPRLDFVAEGADIFPGDEVYTSGDDGILPRGLRVGAVVGDGASGLTVQLHADPERIDYVSVLFFAAPSVPVSEAPSPLSEESAGEPPVPLKRSSALALARSSRR